jgi:hypothetical protein
MNEIESIESYLADVANYKARTAASDEYTHQSLKSLKANAVTRGDQEKAKLLWCYEQILRIQQSYLSAFELMKYGLCYKAWCQLERVEIDLNSLYKHFNFTPDDKYKLLSIEKSTTQFQSLFPYKMFISPVFVVHEKKCSICGQVVSISNPCKHRKGEIYNGEMCVHEITNAEFLELSLVTNPLQKYSVVFLSDENGDKKDHYDYRVVKKYISDLSDPFTEWEI